MTLNKIPETITVSRLNYLINNLLSINYPVIRVEGEISQLVVSKMGHSYFTLKDEESCARCVCFRSDINKIKFVPKNGDQIVVTAVPTIYFPRGDFQLRVSNIDKAGSGKLFEKFEILKQKLLSEGLFDSEKKIKIPTFFDCVGIVTSIDSAALRDAVITFENKLPRVKLKVFPSLVQGEHAKRGLIEALDLANNDESLDVIILIRGGGSLEDLWVFNEESLVRSIAKISKPIITGIGHESDTTLCDLVADYRAATPTAAVERLGVEEEKIISSLDNKKLSLESFIKGYIRVLEQKLDMSFLKIKSPRDEINLNQNNFLNAFQRLKNINSNLFKQFIFQLDNHKKKLNVLDPNSVLKRGFCIVYERNSDNVISSVDYINTDKNLDIQFFDGNAKVTVNEIKKKNRF